MVNDIIRKNADGFDVNFGSLVVVELKGIKFAMEDWRAKQLGLNIIEGEEVPEFFTDLKLVMQYTASQIEAYVFDKADIKPLGERLSVQALYGLGRNPELVYVAHKSRTLMSCWNGVVYSEQVTIDYSEQVTTDLFYEVSAEEIEASRF